MIVKRLGIVATAQPSHGGQFQYTLAMMQGLCQVTGWRLTVYRDPETTAYSPFGLEERPLRGGKLRAVFLAVLSACGIRAPDQFADEDAVIAPMYAPQLLHTRKPFCYTLHDLQEYYFPQYFSLYQKIWRRFLHGRLTKRARRVICESKFVQADIVKHFGIEPRRICVVPAPPLWEDAGNDNTDLAAISQRYRLPARFLLYPAQFWAHKNHQRLLEAFAEIYHEYPDLFLVFTGHRRFEYDAVMRKVADLGLTERVIHLGYVDSRDIFSLYRLAQALVMPSLFESISIPVYEAFRAGTPVCASGVFGLTDQIGSAGIIFDPYSVSDMAGAMRRVVGDAELRRRLVAEGRGVLAGLTIQRYAGQLQDVLAELLDD